MRQAAHRRPREGPLEDLCPLLVLDQGLRGVGISKAELEGHFVRLLGCMQPTAELIAQLPNIARSQWEQRKERISEERRVLNTRLNDQKALKQKAITAFLNGALSEEDLQAVTGNVLEQMNLIREQLKSLTAQEKTLGALMEDAKQQVVNLARTWHKARLNQRKELQLSVFPDGLRFPLEKLFFAQPD